MRVLRHFPAVCGIACLTLWAQLPPSGTLSDSDWPLVRAEIARVEKLLASSPDKTTVTYEVARTWAFAKQWPETMEWLRKVDITVGIDPSRDSVFTELHGTNEFDAIVAAARAVTSPVSHSRPAFQVAEGDLVPESIAYDPKGKEFYFGSTRKGKVLRCSASGECGVFATGLGSVLGLKAHGGELWLLSNIDKESALIGFDLASGRVARRYPVAGTHEFNDLVIAPSGDIYLSDTRANAVWQLPNGAADLRRLAGDFGRANGIALSSDGRLLYVSTFPEGIRLVDLKTNNAQPIPRPGDLCLATIDGLYFYNGGLIAIQNAFMSPRVVRLHLAQGLRSIDRFEILERRNRLFDGVTTGVIAGSDFFYMANIQDEKQNGFDPIAILKLPL